jgi:hypothetical protein
MSIVFVAVRITPRDLAQVPFGRRQYLLKKQYEPEKWPCTTVRSWCFEESGIAVWVAYQNQKGKGLGHECEAGQQSHFLTHLPFGYRSVTPSSPLNRLPADLAAAIDADPSSVLKLAPPLGVLTVDRERHRVVFRNDALGLGKTFLLQTEHGVAIANRPFAAHLMLAHEPEPDAMGWASEQLHGWYLRNLTQFRDTRRLLGGTIVALSASGVEETRRNYAARWFHDRADISVFDGFERFAAEAREFTQAETLDVALSGGRDSRASAAVAAYHFAGKTRFRTNEPPLLEGILARQLIERLPYFDRFNEDKTQAYAADGRMIWRSNVPKINEGQVFQRATQWAAAAEGVMTSAAIYNNPPASGVFQTAEDFHPSISGVAGESAKAYYWSPRQLSGAFATNLAAFRHDIKMPIAERMKHHPLTSPSAFPFVSPEYRRSIASLLSSAVAEAHAEGIHGYRFLDYWWFTDRFGAGRPSDTPAIRRSCPIWFPPILAKPCRGRNSTERRRSC